MAGKAKTPRYRAFITYSHRDRRWAAWLHRRLEAYRVPRRLVDRNTVVGTVPRRLTPIFRDREELATAEDLGERIRAALSRSESLIVICSPAAARSRWVNEEILSFKRHNPGKHVFCLIVAGTPFASEKDGAEDSECFPPALRYRLDKSGELAHEFAEPLAADVRPDGDGRTLAKLKLVAGLLGLDLDELRQREQQRRTRRFALITAAALLIATVTALLAVEALISRHAAVVAREQAIVQKNLAERRRAQAESLVAFMLGNLTNELQPIGHLDLLDMIAKRALDYYASQNISTLDGDSLARRAKALRLIGHVDELRGNLDAALAVYKQAEATTAALLAKSPNDPTRIFDEAQSVWNLGDVAWERGQLDTARKQLLRYQALARRLVSLNPNNPKWQQELGDSYVNLGVLLHSKGSNNEASVQFRKALEIYLALSRQRPRADGLQWSVAQARANLADTEERLGYFDEAVAQRTAELAIYKRLLAKDPTNSNIAYNEAVSEQALARLAIDQGDLSAAETRLNQAKAAADGLVTLDASNTTWQFLDGTACEKLAEVLYFQGNLSGASKALAKAHSIAASLVHHDSSVLKWQTLLGSTLLLDGRLAFAKSHMSTALKRAEIAITTISDTLQAHPSNQTAKRLLAEAQLLTGDALHSLGRTGSVAAWSSVLATIGGKDKDQPPDLAVVLGLACTRLGALSRARAIAERLITLGYRAPEFARLQNALAAAPQQSSAAQSRRPPDHATAPAEIPFRFNPKRRSRHA